MTKFIENEPKRLKEMAMSGMSQQEIADVLHISNAEICNRIKRHFGITFGELRRRGLKEKLKLVSQGRYRINDVRVNFGYSPTFMYQTAATMGKGAVFGRERPISFGEALDIRADLDGEGMPEIYPLVDGGEDMKSIADSVGVSRPLIEAHLKGISHYTYWKERNIKRVRSDKATARRFELDRRMAVIKLLSDYNSKLTLDLKINLRDPIKLKIKKAVDLFRYNLSPNGGQNHRFPELRRALRNYFLAVQDRQYVTFRELAYGTEFAPEEVRAKLLMIGLPQLLDKSRRPNPRVRKYFAAR